MPKTNKNELKLTRLLRDLANAGVKVRFEEDWGDNTITISLEARKEIFSYIEFSEDEEHTVPARSTHTHLGFPDCTDEQLYIQLINLLEHTLKCARAAA